MTSPPPAPRRDERSCTACTDDHGPCTCTAACGDLVCTADAELPPEVLAELVTDDDVHDIAEWLHPRWFDSEHGRAQTYSQLEEAVRGALESRLPAIRDRYEQRVRRECAEELRWLVATRPRHDQAISVAELRALADRWSTPPDQTEETDRG